MDTPPASQQTEGREVRVSIQLRWRDMDTLGHLNQAVFHELLEEGRSVLFEAVAGDRGFPFVLARVELDYRREVRRSAGQVEVVSRVTRIGNSSVTVEHELLLADGEMAAVGKSVMVAWDGDERRPRPISDDERAMLSG